MPAVLKRRGRRRPRHCHRRRLIECAQIDHGHRREHQHGDHDRQGKQPVAAVVVEAVEVKPHDTPPILLCLNDAFAARVPDSKADVSEEFVFAMQRDGEEVFIPMKGTTVCAN